MKKTHSVFLGILSFSVVLILATGCFRPAAPDVTPTPGGGAEAATPGGSDLEMTAIANSTRAAQTLEAQTAEAEAPGEEEEPTEEEPAEEATEPATVPAPTSTPASVTETEPAPTATPEMVTEETATPVPVQPTATTAPTTGDTSGTTTYVVQAGDTLFSIATRYGTTVDAISQANGIVDPTQIYVGQELTIPTGGEVVSPPSEPSTGGTTYVVQPSDPNLFRIATRYGISWQRLAAYNGISAPYVIYPGMVLQIPPE